MSSTNPPQKFTHDELPTTPGPEILFVSMGMFIIDTIIYVSGETLTDVIGGAGTFAALGARFFSPPKSVGFIVDYGTDTPPWIESTISSLGFETIVQRHDDRCGTRGLNTYVNAQTRLFEYLTPKIRVTVDRLKRHPRMLRSKSFHLICAPDRYIALHHDILAAREALPSKSDPDASIEERAPVVVWEPVPDSCIPSNRASFEVAWKLCDVISPNLEEAAALLDQSLPNPSTSRASSPDDVAEVRGAVQSMAKAFRQGGAKVVVIRCGSLGAYVSAPKDQYNDDDDDDDNDDGGRGEDDAGEVRGWFPAFFDTTQQHKVIDPTGAGNAFCGALAVSLATGHSLTTSMSRASVAAALVVQQVGLPRLVTGEEGEEGGGREVWSAGDVQEMVREYRRTHALRLTCVR